MQICTNGECFRQQNDKRQAMVNLLRAVDVSL